MLDDDEVTRLIEEIYEAGLDPARWSGLIADIAGHVGGTGGALHVGAAAGSGFGFGAAWNVNPEALEVYEQYYHRINPLNAALARRSAGTVVADHVLVPREQCTEFWGSYGARYGIAGSATVVLENDGQQVSALGITRTAYDVFEPSELRLLRALAPHLCRAFAVSRRFEDLTRERDAALEFVNHLEVAFVLVDHNLRVRHFNSVAEAILSRNDGLSIQRGRLAAARPDDNKRLAQAVGLAAAAKACRGGDFVVARPSGRRGYRVSVCAATGQRPAALIGTAASVGVFIADPEQNAGGVARALEPYHLTPSETAVVEQLVGGKSIAEAAEFLGIAKTTARNHLYRAFAKTGTRRQAELVRLAFTNRAPTTR